MAGGAEQALDPNREGLGRLGDGARVTAVPDQVADRRTGRAGRRTQKRTGREGRGIVLDIITVIYDNDHGDHGARDARTAGQRGASRALLLSSRNAVILPPRPIPDLLARRLRLP